MKKTLVFAVILALLLPAAAFAATEFTLGGFVKLDTFWDSTQAAKNANTPIARDNNLGLGAVHHGRFKSTAQGSRFNFTIKGPKLWGATTTGYLEIDFDPIEYPIAGTSQTPSNSFTPRLRHAMFRFNWPTTELLFGQYWSMFCEFYNESVQDGPLQGHGMPTARLPQIRVTQKLPEGFEIAGLIGKPNSLIGATNQTANSGEASETPQIQAKLQYQQDLWGKAAYYGRPMPFTARVIGGWQRNAVNSGGLAGALTFGQDFYGATNALASIGNHAYLMPWMIMGNVFIPVLPTHSANLAGTASLSAQWYVGQGLGAFGEALGNGQNDAYFAFNNLSSRYNYEERLFNQFGGYIQGQYYFTNHWFTNVTWGMSRVFNVPRDVNAQLVTAANPFGSVYASNADQYKMWQEVDFTLWYRPITAIKFGLQYGWSQTTWLQSLSQGVPGNNSSSSGTAHRVEFVGYFYF
jgi:hypothetical protein